MRHMSGGTQLTLFLCGDVMTGRGVDQCLPRSCPPHLYEPVVTSALDYVALAERAHGPIPRPAECAYVWGDALAVLERERPGARVINLETSVTVCEDAEAKGINYRMHPGNVPVLTAARIDCCVLANNHVLDWGAAGLLETLDTLEREGIQVAGAGRDLVAAQAPAVLELASGSRMLVFAFGATDSGIPPQWGAGAARPGVHLLPDFSRESAEEIGGLARAVKRPGDIVVASVHWGPNWGFDIPTAHRRFAHALIDRARIDIVHGHSSHHPIAIEVYRGRPIFYGCGDFLNDYEGISGYEAYRDDLTLMYFAAVDPARADLVALEMVPLQIRRFQLTRPSNDDVAWLAATLDRVSSAFGARIGVQSSGRLTLSWR
jgi:poly-gamma-glutamate capsule biosynthesis protein CapA/YwtB (metallophosphatase superfamily)